MVYKVGYRTLFIEDKVWYAITEMFSVACVDGNDAESFDATHFQEILNDA